MKKVKWSPIKEIVFTYLAVNKIMYWANMIITMHQSDLGNVGHAVLMRVLNQDLLLIIGVTAFYFVDKLINLKKSKYSSIAEYAILYAIGYVMLLGLGFMYNLIMVLIFSTQEFSMIEFVRAFISFVPSYTMGYLIATAALEIKQYFKKMGEKSSKEILPDQSTEEKLTMLHILLNDGILTQEEFDQKKMKLLCL